MKNSNQNSRSDSGYRGRDFGGRGFRGRTEMHHATCAECGQDCEVPFRPSGDKPVYCNACFAKRQGDQPRRSEGRDFGRPSFGDKKMYSAICDKCGKPCQVPFQPTPGKQVFCDICFGKGGDVKAIKGDQLSSINAKLDKILAALASANLIKPAAEAKKAKEEKPAAIKTEKKKAVKKAVGKKKK